MAGCRGRGRPATKRDPVISIERYIVSCGYFQLHGKEGIVAEIEPEIDGKAKTPLISAPDPLRAIRVLLPEYTSEGPTNYHYE